MTLALGPHAERTTLAHRRLAAAYAREPGHEVPVVWPGGPTVRIPFEERIGDLDKMTLAARSWAEALMGQDNDWPPFIDTFCGVVMIAEAFRCEVLYTPGEDPWTEPAVTDLEDVWKLKPLRPMESPLIRRLLEWTDHAQRVLGSDLPIWTMDIQSPFSVAARVCEPQELMMGCVTDPKAVHHLCDIITDYTIEVMKLHIERMEHPAFPGRNFPSISDPIGVCIADDTPLVMLSPDMYAEFSLPYNNRIGEAFGGIHIHSCGQYRHNLDNLRRITNIRSIQLHGGPGEYVLPETAAEDDPLNRARAELAYFVDSGDVARGDDFRNRPKAHYADYTLPRLTAGDTTGLILQACGPGGDMPDADAGLGWTRAELARRRAPSKV